MLSSRVMLSAAKHLNRTPWRRPSSGAVEILRFAQNDTNARARFSHQRENTLGTRASRLPAFTLIELMVVIAIIIALLGLTTMAFRSLRQDSLLADAKNSLISYAKVARSYAIAHQIETMLVINPINGRFELWYLNPPASGGEWSPQSEGTQGWDPDLVGAKDPRVDGYAFAPVLDSAARLPHNNGVPLVAVHPIDWEARPDTGADAEAPEMDNLIWSAVCFDADGRLVVRTRRIATRGFYKWNSANLLPDEEAPRHEDPSPRGDSNRLVDGAPDVSLLLPDPNHRGVPGIMVTGFGSNTPGVGDTPITSTSGFILSDRRAMEDRLRTQTITPWTLKYEWLRYTAAPRSTDSPDDIAKNVTDFSDTILLNRFSGQELAKGS